ncbi:MAG TPA: hypothetical protein VFV39_00700 [Limnobacter sp.]|nr:hypothetical protein [Limnobacter sp.]
MKSIKLAWPDWLRFSNRSVFALSLAVGEVQARWVYGEVIRGDKLHFKSIHGHGGVPAPVFSAQSQSIPREFFVHVLEQVMSALPAGLPRPQLLVVCLPAKHAYLGEVVVPEGEEEQAIEFQIQELMEAAAGNSQREAAFDWQVKSRLSDGNLTLAVAGVDQQQVDEVLAACQQLKLTCAGITLDSVAALNGYVQMIPDEKALESVRFLLHGELSRHRIRLAVFSQGVLFHESSEHSDEGFSLVQSISALERLVATWARDGAMEEPGSVRLVLGGETMYAKGCDATVRRSQILSPRLLDVRPRKELANQWHDSVVPFGALEAMPCA